MNKMITPALLTEERILWEGKAFRGIIFRPIDLFLVPLSLVFGGLSLLWIGSAEGTTEDQILKLGCLPILVVGLYGALGRFVVDAIIRRKIAYFVTNKRVLIVNSHDGSTAEWVGIDSLPSLELDERPDGSGTIRFGNSVGWWTGNFTPENGRVFDQLESDMDMIWQPMSDPTPQFIRIPNARSVYELIQSLIKQ
jgi:hypothetical protein